MNTKLESSLSDADKKALGQIDKNFTVFELILGAEPGIYYEFNIQPPAMELDELELNQKRMELFSGSVFHQA